MTQEQVATRRKLVRQSSNQSVSIGAVKVDDHVAAEDGVKQSAQDAEVIVDEVQPQKRTHPPYRIVDLPAPGERTEVAIVPTRIGLAKRRGSIDALNCGVQGLARQVGADDPDIPAIEQATFDDLDSDRIRLFTTRAARRPYAQRTAPGSLVM